MKKLEIIIRPGVFERVKTTLTDLHIQGLNYTEIKGFGRQHGHTEVYRGTTMRVDCLPKIKVEVVLPDSKLEEALNAVVFMFAMLSAITSNLDCEVVKPVIEV